MIELLLFIFVILIIISNVIYRFKRRKYNAILTDKQLDYLQNLRRKD